MSEFSKKVNEGRALIAEMTKDLKTPQAMVGHFLVSLLFAALIVAGPIALFINLLIFTNLQNIAVYGILLMIFLLIFLTRVFYIQSFVKQKLPQLQAVYRMEALIALIITAVLAFLLIII